MHRPRRRRQLIVAGLAGLLLANGAGCSSCVKDEQTGPASAAPDISVNPKIKIVDKRMHPRIGEEGGFLVPFDAGTD